MATANRPEWTAEERARESRVREIRARDDRDRRPEERLEETLRLSRLMAELREGVSRDVPGR
jgi:hypothetical protein